jgi:hypothetical protein
MDAHVHALVSMCEICGGLRGTGTGFSPSSLFSFVSIITSLLSILITWGMNSKSGHNSGAYSYPINMNKNKSVVEMP